MQLSPAVAKLHVRAGEQGPRSLAACRQRAIRLGKAALKKIGLNEQLARSGCSSRAEWRMKMFEKQMKRFVIRFVLGAVVLAGLCVAAYAGSKIVSGTGTYTNMSTDGSPDGSSIQRATEKAQENLNSACSGGNISGVSVAQSGCDRYTCTVTLIATCSD